LNNYLIAAFMDNSIELRLSVLICLSLTILKSYPTSGQCNRLISFEPSTYVANALKVTPEQILAVLAKHNTEIINIWSVPYRGIKEDDLKKVSEEIAVLFNTN